MHGENASVSVHTASGALVAEFAREELSELSWTRKRKDVTQCDLAVSGTGGMLPMLRNIHPWYHHASVWEGDSLVWTGPILVADRGRDTFTLSARDISTFAWRTRVPFARRWSGTTPVSMSADMFQAMLDLRDLSHVRIVQNATTDPVAYDYVVAPDTRQMNSVLDDLVKMGLEWTVVAGTIVLGAVPKGPVAVLDSDDIVGDIRYRRDGSKTYTDVRVQGQNFAHTERVPGPILQNVVNLDTLRGVGNIQRAAREYATMSSRQLESIIIPAGSSLSPDAPVTLDMLIPGATFHIYSEEGAVALELTEAKAVLGDGGYDLQVTLDSPSIPTTGQTE